MAYQSRFLNEKLIFQTVTGRYSETELRAASQEMADQISKNAEPCYVLLDLSRMKAIENQVVNVKNAVQPLFSHPHLKLVLAYGKTNSTVLNFLSHFLANFFKVPVKLVDKQEEAIAYLLNQEPSFEGILQAALQKLKEENV